MVSGRPLLYMSLPGLAFILGVFWFRRKNKNHLESVVKTIDGVETDIFSPELQKEEHTIKPVVNGIINVDFSATSRTKSISISDTLPSDDENRIFGKSAPIKIVQNGRGTSPVKQSQVDSEILKSKIKDAGHKSLRSIEEGSENLSSPIYLPDSVNNRMTFYARNVDIQKDKPVVIMATTTPKISPENSFLESKYTEAEQNNNFGSSRSLICGSSEDQIRKTLANRSDCALSIREVSEIDSEAAQDGQKSTTVNATERDAASVNQKRNMETPSPPISLNSVQSGDSGKGSSLPRSEANQVKSCYEFLLPISLVGHLCGRKRSYLTFIKTKTNASIGLRQKINTKLRVCAVEGTESEIQAALALIRQRLPISRYPNLTMQKIYFALPQSVVPLSTETLLSIQLNLIEGINNDVVVCSVVTGGHIFVQHPLHPSHPSFTILHKDLCETYTAIETPLLPGIELNAVCVMPSEVGWFRVQIVNKDTEEEDMCTVKLLDFGGYKKVHFNDLRQIRTDFMSVPFQSTECILANIEPIGTCWSADFFDILTKLTKGIILQAQVAGYNSENIPEIYLFACLGQNNVVFINKELVARNLAKWVE